MNHSYSTSLFPLHDHPFLPQDPLGYLPLPPVTLYSIPEQNAFLPMAYDPEYGPKIIGEFSPPTFGDQARCLASGLVHEVFDGVAEIVSLAPQFMDEIGAVGSLVLPEKMLQEASECFLTGSRLFHYEESVAKGHEYIDQVFGTDDSSR